MARATEAAHATDDLDALVRGVLPAQGRWRDDDYLWLTERTRRLVELTDGRIETLPMPTDTHQGILHYLNDAFSAFVRRLGGCVRFAPLRLRIREGKYREPDLLLVTDAGDPRRRDRFWLGADLVAEVVNPERPERDLVDKRLDYAEGGIPEYWIVDPADETVTVLVLDGGGYVEHGTFRRGAHAASVLLDGFTLDVSAAFAAGRLD